MVACRYVDKVLNMKQSCNTMPLKMGLIHDVLIHDLKIIPTNDGAVLHMLRLDSPLFKQFGEVYFSELNVNSVNAWKMHTKQSQNLAVPYGEVKVVLCDLRIQSPCCGVVQEVFLGREQNYQLLYLPPFIWYGFANTGSSKALICNCVDLPHDPQEGLRKNKNFIAYSWD